LYYVRSTSIAIARKKRAHKDFEIKGKIYAFDSTTIDLCLSVFWWATFRKKKAGIKLHTLYDITTEIPAFIHLTAATVNDVNAMDVIPYETEAYYIFDRGYVDYTRLYRINLLGAWFVIRAKSNLQFNRMYSRKVDTCTPYEVRVNQPAFYVTKSANYQESKLQSSTPKKLEGSNITMPKQKEHSYS